MVRSPGQTPALLTATRLVSWDLNFPLLKGREEHGVFMIAQLVKNLSATWVVKIRWRRDRLPTPVFLGFSCGSAGKESACNVGDLVWIPGLDPWLGKIP